MNKYKEYLPGLIVGLVLVAGSVFATAPLDLTTTGTTLAGYVATAATAALGILAAILGVRVIIRAFKSVMGR